MKRCVISKCGLLITLAKSCHYVCTHTVMEKKMSLNLHEASLIRELSQSALFVEFNAGARAYVCMYASLYLCISVCVCMSQQHAQHTQHTHKHHTQVISKQQQLLAVGRHMREGYRHDGQMAVFANNPHLVNTPSPTREISVCLSMYVCMSTHLYVCMYE